MEEREKMINGERYNPADKTLLKDREYAKTLCYEYNNLPPSETKKRKDLLQKILSKTGENFLIEQPFQCDYGCNIEIGENFYANHGLIILDPAKVKFGNNVFIGPNCGFYTPEHPLDAENRIKGYEYAFPINIGNNVWFGGNVVILSGVTIGDNSVIGAGSVVTKDIPANVIAAGNPCKVIREITEKDKFRFDK